MPSEPPQLDTSNPPFALDDAQRGVLDVIVAGGGAAGLLRVSFVVAAMNQQGFDESPTDGACRCVDDPDKPVASSRSVRAPIDGP